jgi:hypothetical protein
MPLFRDKAIQLPTVSTAAGPDWTCLNLSLFLSRIAEALGSSMGEVGKLVDKRKR